MRSDIASLEDLDDVTLIRLSLSKAEAFGVFYDRHEVAVLSYFLRRTSCPHTSADLMAETFAQALRSAPKYKEAKGQPRAWLFGIAHHQLTRFLRHKAVSETSLRRLGIARVTLDDAALEQVDHLIDRSAHLNAIAEELPKLPTNLSEAVRLRFAEDLSFEEVGRQLGCSPGAARVRVSRALSKLAEVINA